MTGEKPIIKVDGEKAGIALRAMKAAYDEAAHMGCGPWDVRYALLMTFYLDIETAYARDITKEELETFAVWILGEYLKKYSKNPLLWKI